jgi:hypothetical protein
MSPDQLQSLLALAVGFAIAGMLASGYQWLTARPASFRLLSALPQTRALAAVPFLVFAAPFIIMRNTLRARRLLERRFGTIVVATVLAGVWSLMSGTAVLIALQALGTVLA